MSATHSRFGAVGPNWRCTRSAGRAAAGSAIVVRLTLPRTAPVRPSSAISRSTVQRATWMPSRLSCQPHLAGAVDAVVRGVDPRDLRL